MPILIFLVLMLLIIFFCVIEVLGWK